MGGGPTDLDAKTLRHWREGPTDLVQKRYMSDGSSQLTFVGPKTLRVLGGSQLSLVQKRYVYDGGFQVGTSNWPFRCLDLAKTKFAFVNGQKCDETHNT